ncbi:selenocysteine insertion sequence-binding protein 2-like [Pollicipes pollicipes]|uniref:selenocysteine insertion sequence-binding protein 2-like n=1 Tax=Pollicipes pollicipes TaxID=41117 RepID=UPI001884F153|nr:selenocysteine insertion sequence-binding protein 2-like [Pollicipes pollicipes]
MAENDVPDNDGDWMTVGARPRRNATQHPKPVPDSTAEDTAARKKRATKDEPGPPKRAERKDPDWHLVMRSRQALTMLRDEDFALTRLGQIHTPEPRKPESRPANRSRLGAKFPMSMASDRPNRPVAVLRRGARLTMPKFDLPLGSEADFPSLRADDGDACSRPKREATRKSERRDLVREDIREDVAMLKTPAAADGAKAETDEASARKKEKRALKKAKKKESQLILARMNASKDTHVQLYPSLEETTAPVRAPDEPGEGASPPSPPPVRRQQSAPKSYSRMLRELPKKLPAPGEDSIEVLVVETKKKNPKKRTPIEMSLMDLADRTLTRPGANRLDSTVLVRHRGKERLVPKKKKPSLLKRVILRERAERRRRRAGPAAEAGGDEPDAVAPVEQPTPAGADQQSVLLAALQGIPAPEPRPAHSQLATLAKAQPGLTPAAAELATVATPKSVTTATAQPVTATHQANAATVQPFAPAKVQPVTPVQQGDPAAAQQCASPAAQAVVTERQSTPANVQPASAARQERPTPVEDQQPITRTNLSEPPAADVDSDEEAPPSRGPSYEPTLSVDPKLLIHSRKFREYCQQTLSPEIDDTARLLLQDLTRFQDRLYSRDPIKARSRRRLVYGLREVSKHLAIKKLACVILAPNIEKIENEGGLDQAVQSLLTRASEREVPLVCALKRRALGHACKKPVPVSCVGIFNYQGSEDNFKRLMQLTEAAQERYRTMVREVEQALRPQPVESASSQLLGVFDRISRQQPAEPPSAEPLDDPTHTLLAKLRAVALDSPPQVSG